MNLCNTQDELEQLKKKLFDAERIQHEILDHAAKQEIFSGRLIDHLMTERDAAKTELENLKMKYYSSLNQIEELKKQQKINGFVPKPEGE